MGSEHYCLRWNNHQSNLLGVFSQLLQDESLVDVTLACSEGASIRAHKVVLSACSSYFQSLFLDHPSRHPIVILKDVQYPELKTLVEFMYRGEVNVQYCQLSALLKTAESLKVKGLAEMTNQNPASHEPEHESDLRSLSANTLIPKPETLVSSIPSSSMKSTTPTPSTSGRLDALGGERCQSPNSPAPQPQPPPPPLRLHSPPSPNPLSIYHRKSNHDRERERDRERDHRDREYSSGETTHMSMEGVCSPENLISIEKEERPSSPDDDDDEIDDDDDGMSNDVGENLSKFTLQRKLFYLKDNNEHSTGLNMAINSSASSMSHIIAPPLLQSSTIPPITSNISSSSSSSHTPDMRPLSRGGSGNGGGGGSSGQQSSSVSSTLVRGVSSREMEMERKSSPMSEPIAGPSGMVPVQIYPLSLKKESDTEVEFRHPHDTEATESQGGIGGDRGGGSGGQLPPDQGGPMYMCPYCGASFPQQSKLTRHILSHSLETLKYRETAHLLHPGHLNFLPHELPPQHFIQRPPPHLDPLEPPDTLGCGSSPMDIEFGGGGGGSGGSGVCIPGGSSSGGAGSNSDPGNVVLCKFCGKSFPDVSSLISHLPIHTGDRPFKCEFCGKAFKLRHHMKDHCRVHTGERPFRCGMCGKTFSRSTILKAHEKTHFPKYVRKFLSPSPVDTKDEPPQ